MSVVRPDVSRTVSVVFHLADTDSALRDIREQHCSPTFTHIRLRWGHIWGHLSDGIQSNSSINKSLRGGFTVQRVTRGAFRAPNS